VPLFQEQLMEMAVAIAGFSAAEADELRQAMAAKRSAARMARLRDRLYQGMAERGITGEVADTIHQALAAFANFGFPESHSASFAHLVYCSGWLKHHYPAAFFAGLLNSQPMGFWSPQSLIADAKRHGVRCGAARVPQPGDRPPGGPGRGAGPPGHPPRAGLGPRAGRGARRADRRRAPWADAEDLVRRAQVSRAQLEVLAAAGALDDLGPKGANGRRRALWGPGPQPRAPSTGCRGSWWGPRPPTCPSRAPSRRWATTSGRSVSPRTGPPWSWPAPPSTGSGCSRLPRCGRRARPRGCWWRGW